MRYHSIYRTFNIAKERRKDLRKKKKKGNSKKKKKEHEETEVCELLYDFVEITFKHSTSSEKGRSSLEQQRA